MEFLGVGYQEFLLILVLLLVVVGPERFPQMAYQVGRAVREMQKYARAVRDEFSEEMGFIQEQYDTMKGEVDEARHALREETQQFDREMRSVTRSMEQEVPEELKNPNKVIPISSGATSTSRTNKPTESPDPGTAAATGTPTSEAGRSATSAIAPAAVAESKPADPPKKGGGDPPLVF